jgi:ribonuclease HI
MAKYFKSEMKTKNPRLLVMSHLDFEIPWGFFDGAFQGHPPMCGVGVVLHLKKNHYIHIRYAPSSGTNNRVEFIALWTLLEAGIKKVVRKLQVLGNSMLVVEWEKQKIKFQDIRIESLLRDIKLYFLSF